MRAACVVLAIFVTINLFAQSELSDDQKTMLARIDDSNRWWAVYLDVGDLMVSFDKRLARRQKDIVNTWLRWDYNPPKKQETYPYKNIHHSLSKSEIDCAKRKVRSTSWVQYDIDGNSIASGEIKETTWQEWIPESIGEAAYSRVCTLVKEEPPKEKPPASKKKKPQV